MRALLGGLLAATLLAGGCSGRSVLGFDRAPASPGVITNVTEVLSLWQEGEGNGEDGLPTRGFAGQIMFFGGRDAASQRIDGDVSIYVFDDRGADPSKPLHVFNFVDGAFDQFRHESKMGTTYQLFVPYTRDTIARATCSLRVKFSHGQHKVMSDAADVVLAGPSDDEDAPALGTTIQTATYEAGKRPAELGPATTTASIPREDARDDRIDAMLAELQAAAAAADRGDSQANQAIKNRNAVPIVQTKFEPASTVRSETITVEPKSSPLKVYTIPLRR